MTDLDTSYNAQTLDIDLSMDGTILSQTDDLGTAIVISLFSDRRATLEDRLPDGVTSRRGWWGDMVPPIVNGQTVENDRIGSRLWLLSREKQTRETLNRAREYAEESLQWLIEDGRAEKVEVEAGWVRMGLLGLLIIITLPDGGQYRRNFEANLRGE